MPDPAGLIAVARLLADGTGAVPSDAQLRRAVSTAYYALFHKILRYAAHRFMGSDYESSAGYRLLYRSFDHGHMRRIFESLEASTLKETLKFHLKRDAVSQTMRAFAGSFTTLQKSRHLADYDPGAVFLPSDLPSLIDEADNAMVALDNVDPDERADVLALLMVKYRND